MKFIFELPTARQLPISRNLSTDFGFLGVRMPTVQSLIEIGQRIKNLRGKKNRSQFAEGFLVAPSTLARWETGESQPDLGFLVRLSGAFGVSLEWIITGNDDTPGNGSALADHQLGYLDKLDWMQVAASPSAPPDSEILATVASAKNDNTAESLILEKTELATVASLELQQEVTALNKELRDLLRQNGDLRVEVERLRARVRDLERELREALKPEGGTPPMASAG